MAPRTPACGEEPTTIPSGPREDGREEAVDGLALRLRSHEAVLALERLRPAGSAGPVEIAVPVQELEHDGERLLVLQGAGGVDDAATAAHQGCECFEETTLPRRVAREVLRSKAPADVRVPTERSEAAARCVEEDRVEPFAEGWLRP